jgi:hypothetical protein
MNVEQFIDFYFNLFYFLIQKYKFFHSFFFIDEVFKNQTVE